MDFLRQCPKLTNEQYQRLRQAQEENVEVGGAFSVPSLLDPLKSEYEPVADPTSYNDEPF